MQSIYSRGTQRAIAISHTNSNIPEHAVPGTHKCGLRRTAQAPIAWPRGLGLRYLGLDWTGLGGVLVQELILVLGLTLVLALILLLVLILILILALACESSKDTQRM